MKTASDVIQAASCLFDIPREDNYQMEYPYFVGFFGGKTTISKSDLIVGANMVYGWMPTILEIKSTDFDSALKALNRAKQGDMLKDDELMFIASMVNNSLVGASKLLHFINPSVYPIWDSRVCNWVFGVSSHYQVNKVERYREYVKLCHSLVGDDEFLVVVRKFEAHIGYTVTPVRVAELVMFTLG